MNVVGEYGSQVGSLSRRLFIPFRIGSFPHGWTAVNSTLMYCNNENVDLLCSEKPLRTFFIRGLIFTYSTHSRLRGEGVAVSSTSTLTSLLQFPPYCWAHRNISLMIRRHRNNDAIVLTPTPTLVRSNNL